MYINACICCGPDASPVVMQPLAALITQPLNHHEPAAAARRTKRLLHVSLAHNLPTDGHAALVLLHNVANRIGT